MKKILSIIAMTVLALGISSCQKADEEFVHTDCTISAIYAVNPQDSTVPQLTGQIDQETGDIYFDVAKKYRKYWRDEEGNPIQVKVRANIGYDAVITPSLFGLKTLSDDEPYNITVTAQMTGETKEYHLYLRFLLQ